METSNNYTSEDLKKCPYHTQLNAASNNDDPREDVNTGDWDDERDETGTDPDRNEEGNNNSGGAGSTGSAATNS